MLTHQDINALGDPKLTVAGLQAYFASRPKMTRRELAQIKPLVARIRYRDVDPDSSHAGLFDETEAE